MDLDLEYIKELIKRATPEHDSPLLVDWVPYVQALVAEVEQLRGE